MMVSLLMFTTLAAAQVGTATSAATATVAAPAPALATTAKDPAPATATAKVKKLFEKGFTIFADDDRFELRLRGNIQFVGRFFIGDDASRFTDTFLLRRVRPSLDGKVFGFATFRIMPDFAGGTFALQDAYADLEAHPGLRLRVGKQKENFSLERLQSQTDLMFVERSQVNGLGPNRDLGAMLHGSFAKGGFTYQLGIWNGVPDGGSSDIDLDDRKDYIGRVFVKPFKLAGIPLLEEVGLGFAASHGIRRGTPANPQLATYRSPNQNRVITFVSDAMATAAGTAIANGEHQRIGPQAAIYIGPVGVMAEYTRTNQLIKRGSAELDMITDGWQVTANFVLTGEKARYTSFEVDHPASIEPNFAFGAIELALRYDTVSYSKAAFGTFIDPARSYNQVDGYYAGFNWHLNGNVKITGNFVHSELKGGAMNLPTKEDAVVVQTQLYF